MTISFKYKSVKRPDDTVVKTPSIPITLIGKESFDTVALLDSGADISAMPKSIAELLGLNLDGNITLAYGICGTAKCVESEARIIIQKGHERYEFSLPIKIIFDEYQFPILLGRKGFFDKFIITFDQKNEKVLIKKRTER